MEESRQPEILTSVIHKQAYSVLGIENKKSELIKNPRCGACWDEFFEIKAPDLIKPYQAEDGMLGVFCSSDPGYWNYLIGSVIHDLDVAPKGMCLRRFPESDYALITHEPVDTRELSHSQIGRLVGYAHGGGFVCPEGYERYYDPVMFIESYPPATDGKYRFELWLPIIKI